MVGSKSKSYMATSININDKKSYIPFGEEQEKLIK
jgi:hypothetical protein